MRFWNDHHLEADSFQDSMRGVIRNTPWYSISAIIHLLLLLVLAQINVGGNPPPATRVMQAELHHDDDEIDDEKDEIPPEPDLKDIETQDIVDPTDDVTSTDDDTTFDETQGDDGLTMGDFTGPSTTSVIGPGGSAGGGDGRGGRRRARGHNTRSPQNDAVMLGLKWLADHQDVDQDGKWDCDDFMKHDAPDDKCDGPGNEMYDVGVTGLALLAFLGAGHTDRGGVHYPGKQRGRDPDNPKPDQLAGIRASRL